MVFAGFPQKGLSHRPRCAAVPLGTKLIYHVHYYNSGLVWWAIWLYIYIYTVAYVRLSNEAWKITEINNMCKQACWFAIC